MLNLNLNLKLNSNQILVMIIFCTTIILSVIVGVKTEHFSYLDHKSKCYSCEQQLGPELAWMAQPTKGFADERESVAQTGSGWLAKTIKGV